jgi:hypothetical protein
MLDHYVQRCNFSGFCRNSGFLGQLENLPDFYLSATRSGSIFRRSPGFLDDILTILIAIHVDYKPVHGRGHVWSVLSRLRSFSRIKAPEAPPMVVCRS